MNRGASSAAALSGHAKVLSLRSWLALITSAEGMVASTSSRYVVASFHRLLIGQGALPVRHRGIILVECRERRDVVALARRGSPMSCAFWIASAPLPVSTKPASRGVVGRDHGQAPVRHATARTRLVIRQTPLCPEASRRNDTAPSRGGIGPAQRPYRTPQIHIAKPIGPGGPFVRPVWSTIPRTRHKATTVVARSFGVHRIGDPSLCKSDGFVQLPRRLSRVSITPEIPILTKFCG